MHTEELKIMTFNFFSGSTANLFDLSYHLESEALILCKGSRTLH